LLKDSEGTKELYTRLYKRWKETDDTFPSHTQNEEQKALKQAA